MHAIQAQARHSRAKTMLLGAASGVALALSVCAGAFPPLAFVFSAALILACAQAKTARDAWLCGWSAGFAANAMIFSWIVELLQAFAHFPLPAAVAVAALLWAAQGLNLAFCCWSFEVLARRGAPRFVVAPALLTLFASLGPSLFPWRPSTSLVEWTTYAQVAELGGVPSLDALVLFCGAMGAGALTAWVRSERQLLRRSALAFVLLLACPALYGSVRMSQVDEERSAAPSLRIGIVQPNISIEAKHDLRRAPANLALLRRLTQRARVRGAEFIVWPETAYPYPLHREQTHEPLDGRGIDAGVPMLIGAITQSSRCGRWNSAVALDADGEIVGVSDKVELLAFGETVPLWEWLPPLQSMFPCPGLARGDRPQTLRVAGALIGPLNCYEDVLTEPARSFAVSPEVLVNITNDAWFGDSAEPHLHQLAARLRAVETRRDLVRAVNTGVSAHIDSAGREVFTTQTFQEDVRIAHVHRMSGQTLFVRFGDWTTPTLFAWVLALIVALRVRRVRSLTR